MEYFLDEEEMTVWRLCQEKVPESDYLLMVSGGLDSMCLMNCFYKLKTRLKNKVRVLYVHHGLESTSKFRDECYQKVKQESQSFGFDFVSNFPGSMPESNLKSEEEFRDFRLGFAKANRKSKEVLVMAHHADDQLETRLIRLIRGTGAEGLLAMKQFEGATFRPFLEFSRKSLEAYAKKFEIPYLEDPSNEETIYLRNWLRKSWLPQLEIYRSGSKESLSRSLENISQQFLQTEGELDSLIYKEALPRSSLLTLAKSKQLQLIARFVSQNGVKKFKKTQLEEILKRLDTDKNEFIFRLLGLEWKVEGGEISVSPQTSPKVPTN